MAGDTCDFCKKKDGQVEIVLCSDCMSLIVSLAEEVISLRAQIGKTKFRHRVPEEDSDDGN